MKILFISADGDYDALNFQEEYAGKTVSELISAIESGQTLVYTEGDYDFDARVIEVGDIDEKFLEFVREYIQDYDDSKHSNFYLENEIIK